MRDRAVEKEELKHMLRVRRLTHAAIAKELGLTVSGVNYLIREYGLNRKQLNHKDNIPWTVIKDHRNRTYKYLVDLSSAAKGKEISSDRLNTALNWAQTLVEKGLDIDYDREAPPNDESRSGGFFTKPADPHHWHLKKVLNKAKIGMTRRLQ